MKSPSIHFICILLFLTVHGCKKDELSQNVKPITLEEAKDVFQKWSIKETDIGRSGILNPRNDSLENSGIYNIYPD